MQSLKYTSKIITLISSGNILGATKEAHEFYGISLREARNMVQAYKQGDSYYTTFEIGNAEAKPKASVPVHKSTTNPSSNGVLHVACPNCGSTQLHKSIGGKAEHAALWGGTKLVKSQLGFFAKAASATSKMLIGKDENDLIKNEVPFQQVCDYCHNTFHARQSQIDAGAYSMSAERAKQLTTTYNNKLQKVKDKEIEETRARASKELMNAIIGVVIFVVGLLIYNNSEHTTEGIFGMTSYTWSFMFSCLMMFIGVVLAAIAGFTSFSTYDDASNIEKMSISQYAKDHSA